MQLFELSEDLNVLASKRVFNSHDVPVNDLALCKKKNWIISGGADGTISISEIGSGVKVSDYRCTIVPKNIDVREALIILALKLLRSTQKAAFSSVEHRKALLFLFESLQTGFAPKSTSYRAIRMIPCRIIIYKINVINFCDFQLIKN